MPKRAVFLLIAGLIGLSLAGCGILRITKGHRLIASANAQEPCGRVSICGVKDQPSYDDKERFLAYYGSTAVRRCA